MDATDYPGSTEQYREQYAEQVQFLNSQLEQVIDSILQNSTRPPIIILQADHGPRMLTDYKSVENTCLAEGFSIFSAYYLPGMEPGKIPEDLTPVNIFRIILNEYFGAGLPLLNNEQYYPGDESGYYLTKYIGLNMKQIDELRGKVREAGGEFHIVKNTLSQVAFKSAGFDVPEDMFHGSTAIVFAFKDAAGMAKIISEYSRTVDVVKIKGGYLGKRAISDEQVKTLSELPPLPVIRAQLMGVLLAPASKLVRTLAEPARSVAAVLKAYAGQDSSAAEVNA